VRNTGRGRGRLGSAGLKETALGKGELSLREKKDTRAGKVRPKGVNSEEKKNVKLSQEK